MRVFFALLTGVFFGASTATAGEVSLTTSDGVHLASEAWGDGAEGVLLVHDEGRSRQDWSTLAPRLAANGFRVLALDLRGHGGSSTAPAPPAEYVKMPADVVAGIGWLESHGASKVHLVGAAFGANLALQVAGSNALVSDVVALSPQLNAQGLKVSGVLAGYGERSLLAVASEDDTLSARAASYLIQQTTGPKHLQLYEAAGSGARMLNGAPDLETLVLSWLNGTFLRSMDPIAAQQANVKTGDPQQIEATGTRLEERER